MAQARRSLAVPDVQPYTYVPLTVDTDPGSTVSALVELDDGEIRRRLAQVVDPVAFHRLAARSVAAMAPVFGFTDPAQFEKLEMISKICGFAMKMVRERIAAANDPSRNGHRLEGETRQVAEQHPISSVSPREKERLKHLARLWKECGVSVDVEISPWIEDTTVEGHPIDGPIDDEAQKWHETETGGRKIDEADRLAGQARHARFRAGFSDIAVPLAIAQRDIMKALIILGRKLAGSGMFGTVPGPFRIPNSDLVGGPFAVSWIRELRFFGHGRRGLPDKPGGPGRSAGFMFDGTMITTDDLTNPVERRSYAGLPMFMAPGSSVLFEGCDTGDGRPGKEFMKAAAEVFFGTEKWGYIRANRQVTTIDPGAQVRGFTDGNPVTLKWPDDF